MKPPLFLTLLILSALSLSADGASATPPKPPSYPPPTSSISSSSSTPPTTTTSNKRPSLKKSPAKGKMVNVPSPTTHTPTLNQQIPLRISFQGEHGAYSEKSLRQLLGPNVESIGLKSFEDCFRSVESKECDYALLPVENSLGGSIHENYDLMLRYNLHIVAEHEFRVRHCFVKSSPKVDMKNIKYAISHPQALAQCDNYLRTRGIIPIPTYDTAGSVKMIMENSASLPPGCTPENTAAIASDLAANIFGAHLCDEGIEDDDSNYTRFLLLSRKGVSPMLTKNIPSKTSVVFTLPNTPGALYKALACFSLRDVDFSKIESRPTSASLLQYLKFRSSSVSNASTSLNDLPRFRYCFYLDFLDHEMSTESQNAMAHLRERAPFLRVLGSYPAKSRLIGPVKEKIDELANAIKVNGGKAVGGNVKRDEVAESKKLKVGFIGVTTKLAKSLAKTLSLNHDVNVFDNSDGSKEIMNRDTQDMDGVEHFPIFDMNEFLSEGKHDVLVIGCDLLVFEDLVKSLPSDLLKKKLIVDINPLKVHPKTVLIDHLPLNSDILITHPMFGEYPRPLDSVGSNGWSNLPFVYERVRVLDAVRANTFLKIFAEARCKMIEMSAETHDNFTGNSQFLTNLVGRLVGRHGVTQSPVNTGSFDSLLDVYDSSSSTSFDYFFSLFKFSPKSGETLRKMRDNLSKLERELSGRESYERGKGEVGDEERRRMVGEVRRLLKESMGGGGEKGREKVGVVKKKVEGGVEGEKDKKK